MPDPEDDPISFEFADEELLAYTDAEAKEERKQIELYNQQKIEALKAELAAAANKIQASIHAKEEELKKLLAGGQADRQRV